MIVESEELDIEGFADNPVNRCYLCKRELFSKILDYARHNAIRYVADGSNVDDLGDYRPGMEAIKELGIVCPLRKRASARRISESCPKSWVCRPGINLPLPACRRVFLTGTGLQKKNSRPWIKWRGF